MDYNKTFVKKTVSVEAAQFNGWVDALTIVKWLDSPAYYVPVGYDHDERLSDEYATSGIKSDAVEFLHVKTKSGWMRVDTGRWLVKEGNDVVSYSPDAFAETYDKKP